DDDSTKKPNIATQDTTPPVVPPGQPVVGPPDQSGPVVPPQGGPRPKRPRTVPTPPPTPVDTTDEEPPSRTHSEAGTMTARLLSAINTHTASQGDTFTAKLEDGPYRGGILSGSIKKLKKGKKNCEMELAFNKLNGKPIPVGLDLVDITN